MFIRVIGKLATTEVKEEDYSTENQEGTQRPIIGYRQTHQGKVRASLVLQWDSNSRRKRNMVKQLVPYQFEKLPLF